MTSLLPYENERLVRSAMKVGDGYDLVAHRDPWPVTAAHVGLDPDPVTTRAVELCHRAPGAFAEAIAAPGIVALGRSTPNRLAGLVDRRAARCALLLR